MNIAVIGAGISGLLCAHQLNDRHDVTLFEAAPSLGGHTNTAIVNHEGRDIPVDTGFIVYNERNYPNFTRLLSKLGVETQPSTMSFSVHDERDGFEYGGHSLAGLLAQPANLLSPRFLKTMNGIRRLAGISKESIDALTEFDTLGDVARRWSLTPECVENYLIPMGAAIWSAPRAAMLAFPARFFFSFFQNHGMLDLSERPSWRTITGGSRSYVEKITAPFRDRCRVGARVERVRRERTHVEIHIAGDAPQRFEEVIFACHSDQALALLADPAPAERDILSAIPYQPNDTVLHTDERLLPNRRAAWSAWNYRLRPSADEPVVVTYNLTMLQSLGTRVPLCVTLNGTSAIDPAKILRRYTYHHPVYTIDGMRARARHSEISAVNRTHYCGAYWFNGFHEDGVNSALRVCAHFGAGEIHRGTP